jgi:hypothetical protein
VTDSEKEAAMKLNRQQIHEQTLLVLEANPQGIHWCYGSP